MYVSEDDDEDLATLICKGSEIQVTNRCIPVTYKYIRVNTGISWQMNMESKHSQSRGECFISNQLQVTCCGHIYVLLISSSVSEYLTLNILDHVVSIS